MRHTFGTIVVSITALIGIVLFTSIRSSTERLSTLNEHSSAPIERRGSIAPIPTWTKVSHETQSLPTNTPLPPTTAPPTPTTVPPTDIPQSATLVGYGNINVRTGPGTEYDIAQRLTAGKSYQIVAKNFNGRWWEIDIDSESSTYKTGWVFADLVDANHTNEVSVAYNIPNTPTPSVQNCASSNLQTYIPRPGPDVNDCHAWELAFNLAAFDYQDAMFDRSDEKSRTDLTHIMYKTIMQLSSNCNTSVDEIVRIAYAAGETIELHGDSHLKSLIRDAPITYIFREMLPVKGSLFQCQSFVAGFLDGLLE